eukprot:TRINITY_DN9161_c0_g1_i1.p1 TRINITY_DN9161_c0_g1~~TRINITY_DN9161_c0_g1_i1.p1  ORF type:complete len:638 (-),score=73.81 TRINITY_DN9161_c0_g1_i1:5-1918(-)
MEDTARASAKPRRTRPKHNCAPLPPKSPATPFCAPDPADGTHRITIRRAQHYRWLLSQKHPLERKLGVSLSFPHAALLSARRNQQNGKKDKSREESDSDDSSPHPDLSPDTDDVESPTVEFAGDHSALRLLLAVPSAPGCGGLRAVRQFLDATTGFDVVIHDGDVDSPAQLLAVLGRQFGPTHFVSVRVASPEIRQAVHDIQEELHQQDAKWKKISIAPEQLHLTFFVLKCFTVGQHLQAMAVFQDCTDIVAETFCYRPMQLHFRGLNDFRNCVVFLDSDKDYDREALCGTAKRLWERFMERAPSIVEPDFIFTPHCTILKIRRRGMRRMRHISTDAYRPWKDSWFGTCRFENIELLAMDEKDSDKYYYCYTRLSVTPRSNGAIPVTALRQVALVARQQAMNSTAITTVLGVADCSLGVETHVAIAEPKPPFVIPVKLVSPLRVPEEKNPKTKNKKQAHFQDDVGQTKPEARPVAKTEPQKNKARKKNRNKAKKSPTQPETALETEEQLDPRPKRKRRPQAVLGPEIPCPTVIDSQADRRAAFSQLRIIPTQREKSVESNLSALEAHASPPKRRIPRTWSQATLGAAPPGYHWVRKDSLPSSTSLASLADLGQEKPSPVSRPVSRRNRRRGKSVPTE